MAVLWMLGNPRGGVTHMLTTMAGAVRRARLDPQVRALAEQIAGGIDWVQQPAAIHNWVQSHIHYQPDPVASDVLRAPVDLIAQPYGDCDDMSALNAALLESIGHPARFQAVAFYGDNSFSHVFAQTRIGNDWVTSDPTPPEGGGPFAFGEEPANITARKTRNV